MAVWPQFNIFNALGKSSGKKSHWLSGVVSGLPQMRNAYEGSPAFTVAPSSGKSRPRPCTTASIQGRMRQVRALETFMRFADRLRNPLGGATGQTPCFNTCCDAKRCAATVASARGSSRAQPGLSRQAIGEEGLHPLAGVETYLLETHGMRLKVIGNE